MKNRYQVIVESQTISFGEKKVWGMLFRPETEERRPAVILSHGYNGSGTDFAGECEYFASHGFVAFCYDFCGGSFRSRSSGSTVDMSVLTEKEDLLAVFDYVRELDAVDNRQIFLFGGSQGGLVSTLVAQEREEKMQGLLLYYPAFCIPDDWREKYPREEEIPDSIEFWNMLLGRRYISDAKKLQPYEALKKLDRNVLIIHGELDDVVPLSYAVRARDTCKNAELVVLKDEGHGFTGPGSVKAMEIALRFMEGELDRRKDA